MPTPSLRSKRTTGTPSLDGLVSSRAAARTPAQPLPLRTVAYYSLPGLTHGFFSGLLTLYLLKFATDVLLIAPAVMGLIFAASRLWDAVSDPMAGYLSDRTRGKLGRRRSWLIGAALPLGLAFTAMFRPPLALHGPALTVWMCVAVFGFFTAYTAFTIPYKAFGAEMSTDPHDRTRVFGGAALTDNIGTILAAGALFAIGSAGDPRVATGRIAAGGAVLGVALILIAAAKLRERPDFQGKGGAHPYGAFRDVLRNPHARVLAFVFFIEFLGFAVLTSTLPYASEYMLKTPKLTFVYVAATIVSASLAVPLVVSLAKRFGKKRVWLGAMLVKTLVFVGIFFLDEGEWMPLVGMLVFFGIAYSAGLVAGPSVKADVIDYDEYHTGERKEGAYFAAWSLAAKGGIAMSMLVGGLTLEWSGYRPNVEQTATALMGIRLLCSGFPALFHLIAAYALWRFTFDERAHARVRDALAAHSTTQPAPAAATAHL